MSIQICCIHMRASLRVLNRYIIRFLKSLQKLYEMCECEFLDIVDEIKIYLWNSLVNNDFLIGYQTKYIKNICRLSTSQRYFWYYKNISTSITGFYAYISSIFVLRLVERVSLKATGTQNIFSEHGLYTIKTLLSLCFIKSNWRANHI